MRVGPWLDYSSLREATRKGLRNVVNMDGKHAVGIERKDGDLARLLYEVNEEREPLPIGVGIREYYWDGSP